MLYVLFYCRLSDGTKKKIFTKLFSLGCRHLVSSTLALQHWLIGSELKLFTKLSEQIPTKRFSAYIKHGRFALKFELLCARIYISRHILFIVLVEWNFSFRLLTRFWTNESTWGSYKENKFKQRNYGRESRARENLFTRSDTKKYRSIFLWYVWNIIQHQQFVIFP